MENNKLLKIYKHIKNKCNKLKLKCNLNKLKKINLGIIKIQILHLLISLILLKKLFLMLLHKILKLCFNNRILNRKNNIEFFSIIMI